MFAGDSCAHSLLNVSIDTVLYSRGERVLHRSQVAYTTPKCLNRGISRAIVFTSSY